MPRQHPLPRQPRVLLRHGPEIVEARRRAFLHQGADDVRLAPRLHLLQDVLVDL